MPRTPPTAVRRSRAFGFSSRASAPSRLLGGGGELAGELPESASGRSAAASVVGPRASISASRVGSPRHPPARRAVSLGVGPSIATRGRAGRGGRHAQRDEVARRHGRGAAHHDDGAEEVLDLRGRGRVDRGLAGDHAAEEPARAVDADEAREAHVAGLALGRGDRDLREQLGPNAPSRTVVVPPWRAIWSAICARISCHRPLVRGAANGCTCSVELA